jgi:hypothetical protein
VGDYDVLQASPNYFVIGVALPRYIGFDNQFKYYFDESNCDPGPAAAYASPLRSILALAFSRLRRTALMMGSARGSMIGLVRHICDAYIYYKLRAALINRINSITSFSGLVVKLAVAKRRKTLSFG